MPTQATPTPQGPAAPDFESLRAEAVAIIARLEEARAYYCAARVIAAKEDEDGALRAGS